MMKAHTHLKADTLLKIAKVQALLLDRYGNDFFKRAAGEKVLLAMSVLANDFKVREQGANNHGEWVEAILDTVNLDEGYAWCAASIVFCSKVANIKLPAYAAVRQWVKWAKDNGRLLKKPERGCLVAYLNPDGTGHIGACAGQLAGFTRSYEGNTSSGAHGSQRDGSGLFARTRLSKTWKYYISLANV